MSLPRILRAPLDDYLAALDRCLRDVTAARLLAIAAGFALSWWVYVPIHELLHVAGCLLGGGEVTRLELSPLYGAALLRRVFPFIAVGSDYAGQLTGFDTRGNDLTYLLTDFLPFALTILAGVPLLRAAADRRRAPWIACLALGVSAPVAFAPFISITGDFYEMGSICVSRLAVLVVPGLPLERWRSDDLIKLAGELFSGPGGSGMLDATGLSLSFLLGTVLAFATYALGRSWPSGARRAVARLRRRAR